MAVPEEQDDVDGQLLGIMPQEDKAWIALAMALRDTSGRAPHMVTEGDGVRDASRAVAMTRVLDRLGFEVREKQ